MKIIKYIVIIVPVCIWLPLGMYFLVNIFPNLSKNMTLFLWTLGLFIIWGILFTIFKKYLYK